MKLELRITEKSVKEQLAEEGQSSQSALAAQNVCKTFESGPAGVLTPVSDLVKGHTSGFSKPVLDPFCQD